MSSLGSVTLVSLESWDQVWRRNQHLVSALLRQELVAQVHFVEPALFSDKEVTQWCPMSGVTVVRPRLRIPKRFGGLRLAAARLPAGVLEPDVLWINDPTFGVHCMRDRHVVYDVTDDWRTFDFSPRIRRRLIRAEDRLASVATTVVCSPVLQQRWHHRYAGTPRLIPNGVDAMAWASAEPQVLAGGPHVGYIGTLHDARLDVELVLETAADPSVGLVHLIGPNALGPMSNERLVAHPKVRLHGAVPAEDVPVWGKSMDVLISPHLVTPFTLSLDALKSYEYLSAGRPVVATATSGFESLEAYGVILAGQQDFVGQVVHALSARDLGPTRPPEDSSWDERAQAFAAALRNARSRGGQF